MKAPDRFGAAAGHRHHRLVHRPGVPQHRPGRRRAAGHGRAAPVRVVRWVVVAVQHDRGGHAAQRRPADPLMPGRADAFAVRRRAAARPDTCCPARGGREPWSARGHDRRRPSASSAATAASRPSWCPRPASRSATLPGPGHRAQGRRWPRSGRSSPSCGASLKGIGMVRRMRPARGRRPRRLRRRPVRRGRGAAAHPDGGGGPGRPRRRRRPPRRRFAKAARGAVRRAPTCPGPSSPATRCGPRSWPLAADRDRDGACAAPRACPSDRAVVGVFTGSLGSRRVNEAVREPRRPLGRPDRRRRPPRHRPPRLGRLRRRRCPTCPPAGSIYQVVAVRGPHGPAACRPPTWSSPGPAAAVSELAAVGLPSILVPLPIAPATTRPPTPRPWCAAGGAVLVPDDELDRDRLAAELDPLVGDPDRRAGHGGPRPRAGPPRRRRPRRRSSSRTTPADDRPDRHPDPEPIPAATRPPPPARTSRCWGSPAASTSWASAVPA